MSNKKILNGWGYVRVSTKAQAMVQHGSLEQQKNIILRWVDDENRKSSFPKFNLLKILEEDESGKASNIHKRDEYKEIHKAIIDNKIDFLVFEKLDRLGRSYADNKKLIELADTKGVLIFETESGRIDLKDKNCRFGFHYKNFIAEEYSNDLEEKISKKQREARVNNGKDTNTVPLLGLDKHPKKLGMYVVNSEEQKQIIDIFENYLRLGYLNRLAEYCLQRGYKTKGRLTKESSDKDGNIIASKSKGGVNFDAKTLRRHLTNKKYLGYRSFKDDWNQFPNLQDENGYVRWEYYHYREQGSVVPEELFLKVQELLKRSSETQSKSKASGFTYLLQGVLFDSTGNRLNGATAKSGSVRYYECRDLKLRIRQDAIEKAVLGRLKIYLKSGEFLKKIVANSFQKAGSNRSLLASEISRIQKEIALCKKADDGFTKALAEAAIKGVDTLKVAQLILETKSQNDLKLEELEVQLLDAKTRSERLNEVEVNKSIEDRILKVLEALGQGCRATVRRLVQALFSKIVIHSDNKLELQIRALDGLAVNGGKKFVLEKNGSGDTRLLTG